MKKEKEFVLYVFIILLFITLASCSSNKPAKKKEKRRISFKKQMTFKEKRRHSILELYRKLRIEDKKNKKKPRYKRTIILGTPVQVKIKPKVNRKEIKKEINQNLIYYCLKHEHSSKFETPDDCREYVFSVLEQCEEDVEDVLSYQVIRCVKSELRKQ